MQLNCSTEISKLFGRLVFLRIYVDLAVFQPYLNVEAGDNQSLKIQVAKPGIEPRSSCSASQELYHSATAAPQIIWRPLYLYILKALGNDPCKHGLQLKMSGRNCHIDRNTKYIYSNNILTDKRKGTELFTILSDEIQEQNF